MALSSDTPRWQTALIVPDINDRCRHIKCSDKEDPKCIRVRYRRDMDNPLYIVAINKCELRFMKCHENDGYEALLMPMKHCEHRNKRMDFNKNKTVAKIKRRYIRGKRDVGAATKSPLSRSRRKSDYYSDYEEEAGHKIRLQNIYDENQVHTIQKLKHKTPVEPEAGQPSSSSSEVHKRVQKAKSKLSKAKLKVPLFHRGDRDGFKHLDLISREYIVSALKAKAVNTNTHSKNSCPHSCPARRVMVCAKCQHGVYRTFISVCHMRMFSCNHGDEKLELISRYPCMLSAPYLSDHNMRPVGKAVDVDDFDPVLHFIRCRELDKLNGKDPYCQIKEQLFSFDVHYSFGVHIKW